MDDIEVVVQPPLPAIEVTVDLNSPSTEVSVTNEVPPVDVVVEPPPPPIEVGLWQVGLAGPPGTDGVDGVDGIDGDGSGFAIVLDEHVVDTSPHPVYDDGPSFSLLYENAKV
jgi:hypothetical protein